MQLGKFEILQELGRGGFGVVYRALDRQLDRIVAIKVLHNELMVNRTLVDRFKQEARLAASLDHPNLVSVYEFGEIQGYYYIEMAYMAGGSLKELLQRSGALHPETALNLITQLANGLGYAHKNNIIHRDLKPGNILLDGDGNPRISNLGFAKTFSSETSLSMSVSGGLVGTPGYMAPEIWKERRASPATDIYSLACIFVEMLTGKPLFDAETTPGIMLKHFEPVVLPPGIPQKWQKALYTALAKDPVERYQTTQEFISALTARGLRNNPAQSSAQNYPGPNFNQQAYDRPRVPGTQPVYERAMVPDGHQEPTSRKPAHQVPLIVGLILFAIIVVGILIMKPWDRDRSSPQQTSLPNENTTSIPQVDVSIGLEDQPAPVEQIVEMDFNSPRAAINQNNISDLQLLTNLGHGKVQHAVYSPGGALIAAAGTRSLLLLDATDLTLIKETAMGNEFKLVDWSNDGSWIAAVTIKDEVFIWDAQLTSVVTTYRSAQPINALLWSPDSQYLTVADSNGEVYLLSVFKDMTKQTITNTGTDNPLISWSFNGSYLAIANFSGNTIRIWRANSGQLMQTFSQEGETVLDIAFSPTNESLVFCTMSGEVRYVDTLDSDISMTVGQSGSREVGVSWHPDGERYATINDDGQISIWTPFFGELLQTFKPLSAIDFLYQLQWSPDGQTIITNGRIHSLKLWDVYSGSLTSELNKENGEQELISWDAGSSKLYTLSGSMLTIWDSQTWKAIGQVEPPVDTYYLVISSDGRFAYSGGIDNAYQWSVDYGNLTRTYTNDHYSVSCIALSPDGSEVAYCGRSGSVQIANTSNETYKNSLSTYGARGGGTVSWTPDGKHITSGGADGSIRFFSASNYEMLSSYIVVSEEIIDHLWSHDGKKVIVTSHPMFTDGGSDEQTVTTTLFDFDGNQLHKTRVEYLDMDGFDWSPDDSMLTGCKQTGELVFFSTDNGALIHSIKLEDTGCIKTAWSGDGRMIAVQLKSGIVEIYYLPG